MGPVQVGENVQAVLVTAEADGGRTRVALSLRLTTPDPNAQTLDDLLAGPCLDACPTLLMQRHHVSYIARHTLLGAGRNCPDKCML